MKRIFLIALLSLAPPLIADCIPVNTYDLVSKTKNIIVAEFIKSNLKPGDHTKRCSWNKKKLEYKIRVSEILGGKLPIGDYELSYLHNCMQKPTDIVFDEGEKVILAAESFKDRKISLVGIVCKWWGWDLSAKKEVIETIKKFCMAKNEEVERFIENSKECTKNEDCDYISHVSAYSPEKSCHRFVNIKYISEIKKKVLSLSGGLCEDPLMMLCKAPLKEFIVCESNRCTFPGRRRKI